MFNQDLHVTILIFGPVEQAFAGLKYVVLVYLNPQLVNVSPSPELVRQGFFINAIIFRLVDIPLFNMDTCYHGQNPVFHWELLQDLTVNNSHNYRLLLLRNYGHIHGTKMTILFWFLIKHTMYFSCNINMQHYSLLSGTFLFTSNFFLSTQ